MLLEITDGTASRGGTVILSHFDFAVRGTENIAIVGRNGAGKTTLLDVLTGRLSLDPNEKNPKSGLTTSRKLTTGFLTQAAVENPEETVEQYVLRNALQDETDAEDAQYDRARYDFETRFARAFTGLGFSLEDRTKTLASFSGGEQTKICLIGLLLREPDLLVLDEPTNHLDLAGVQWLEAYLRSYPKAVVAVSHDRYFIDRFADIVCEVANGKVTRYAGGYTAYREEKTKKLAREKKAYEEQQAELDRLSRLIVQFRNKPRKAAFARSRESILKRMELAPKPEADDAVIHTEEIVPERPGARWVFVCKDLTIGYNAPLKDLTFRLRRGQKIGVLGPNGTGKTAFVRTIAGLLPALSGDLRIGEHVDMAYLDQLSARITSDLTVFDWFHSAFPALTGKEVRQTLAGFLFFGQDMGKKVSDLSGGEKMRLCLAKILQERPNFLILDEPTNNMDIPAKETLESIFRQYQGTILFVRSCTTPRTTPTTRRERKRPMRASPRTLQGARRTRRSSRRSGPCRRRRRGCSGRSRRRSRPSTGASPSLRKSAAGQRTPSFGTARIFPPSPNRRKPGKTPLRRDPLSKKSGRRTGLPGPKCSFPGMTSTSSGRPSAQAEPGGI